MEKSNLTEKLDDLTLDEKTDLNAYVKSKETPKRFKSVDDLLKYLKS